MDVELQSYYQTSLWSRGQQRQISEGWATAMCQTAEETNSGTRHTVTVRYQHVSAVTSRMHPQSAHFVDLWAAMPKHHRSITTVPSNILDICFRSQLHGIRPTGKLLACVFKHRRYIQHIILLYFNALRATAASIMTYIYSAIRSFTSCEQRNQSRTTWTSEK